MLCPACGKKIVEERKGSLTQWIMSETICRCGAASSLPKPLAAPVAPVEESVLDEPEIEIDVNRFPIGRYKPLREIGKGGAGAVYLARDRLLFKLVAVKVLHELTTEQLIGFQSEARALANLSHPSIIELLDFGPTPSGTPYMVLEYFPGMTLAKFIDQYGPLEETVAMRIFYALADGLSLAHSMNILHRDISAANLLVKVEGQQIVDVKIIDFGVAQIEKKGDNPETQGTTLAGTPAYMSPDVANGLRYDARSEIYSFGCLLFEALTGGVPFLGRSVMETINMHAHDQPPMLRDRASKPFSDETEAVVANCLEKNPANRFQSMEAVKDVLLEIDGVLREQRPNSLETYESREPRSATNWRVTLLVVASISTVILIAFAVMQSMKHEEEQKSDEIKRAKIKKEHKLVSPDNVETAQSMYGGFDTLTNDKSFNPTFRITGRTVFSDKLAVAHGISTADQLDSALENYPKVSFLKINLSTIDDAMTKIIEERKTITDLNLRECKISLSNLKRLVSLKRLISLRLNNIPGTNEAILTLNSSKLTHLDIRKGQLDERAVKQIASMKSLEHLEISSGKLSHQMIDEIVTLQNLNFLCLDECHIADADLVKLCELTKLGELSIARCGPFTPGSLEKLRSLNYLSKLWVTDNDLKTGQLAALASLRNLVFLDVSENRTLNFKELQRFKGRPGLNIQVDKTQVTPQQINNAPELLEGTQMDISSKSLTYDE